MKRLHLDFSRKQRSLTERRPVIGAVLLVAGIVGVAAAGWEYRQQVAANIRLHDRADAMRARARNAPAPELQHPDLTNQVAQANAAYDLLQVPWEEIFQALEEARALHAGDIALVSIKANAAKRELLLGGEARNFETVSAFRSALSATTRFADVVRSNDTLSNQGAQAVVAFELRLVWHGRDLFAH